MAYSCHAAYLPIREAYLYAAGMIWRTGKQVLYDAFGSLTGALIFLKYDFYSQAGMYILSVLSVHSYRKIVTQPVK